MINKYNIIKNLTLMLLLFLSQSLLAYVEMQIPRNDGLPNQAYGFSVDIQNNRALVGAYGDYDPSTGLVNGSIYFHEFNGLEWALSQKIFYDVSANPEGLSQVGFGYKVVIQDSIAMVSAPWDFTGTTLNGAVYYYHYNGTQWVFRQKIMGSIQGGYDDFGIDLALDGNVLVVGAPATDHTLNTNVPTEMNFGAAYVFRWNGSLWVEEQVLTGSDSNCFDEFGTRVSVKNNTVVITALLAGPFNPGNIHQEGPGKAYVYQYNNNQWMQSQILTASDGQNGDWYGRSVKITDNFIFVGALKHSTISSVDGAVYVYSLNNNTYSQSQKIVPVNNPNANCFGSSIDSENDQLIVGCGHWSNSNNGAVYMYDLEGSQWLYDSVITHTNPSESGDDLGTSVAISQDKVIAGAPWYNGWRGTAVVFHFENLPPVAVVGPNQTVPGGSLVTLNGSASYDPENSPITYQWIAPAGIILSSNTIANPSFTAPVTDLPFIELIFTLICNDGNSNSAQASVTITVLNSNQMPVAHAGTNNSVLATTSCILDGSASYDPENSPLSYLWTAPEGITLSSNTVSNPFFVAPNVSENTNLTFTLIVNDGEFDSFPNSVIMTVMPISPVQNLTYHAPSLTFSWNPPGATEKTFRYDDGIISDALGANSPSVMLGVAYYENSIIDQVSWYLTADGGPHNTINVVILGLNETGVPDQQNIIYQNNNVTNMDNQWNTLTLPSALSAPNGFYVGLSYNGFLGIAIDDGVGAPYVFQNGTHWVALDWTNGQWQNLEDLDFNNNFMIRAHGLSFGTIDNISRNRISFAKPADNFLIRHELPEKVSTTTEVRNSFFLNKYNVYLDGVLLEEELTATSFTLSNLINGLHTFSVTALYENFIESDAVEFEFSYSGTGTSDVINLSVPYINNYPNPFNPSTIINFNLKQDSPVSLLIFNVKGQKINSLISQQMKSGTHSITWDGKTDSGSISSSGIYFYQLQTNYDKRIGKMMLIK